MLSIISLTVISSALFFVLSKAVDYVMSCGIVWRLERFLGGVFACSIVTLIFTL